MRERLLQAAQGSLLVTKVEKKQRKRYPSPPFTTSTLQQEAVRKLRFSTQRAMRIAQQLYEGIDLGSGGTVGLITYMPVSYTHLDVYKRQVESFRDHGAFCVQKLSISTLPSDSALLLERFRG